MPRDLDRTPTISNHLATKFRLSPHMPGSEPGHRKEHDRTSSSFLGRTAIVLLALSLVQVGCESSKSNGSSDVDENKNGQGSGTLRGNLAASTAADSQPFGFREMAQAAGIPWTYRNGAEAEHCALIESLGGGVAWSDYDGDHCLDAFFTGGGTIDAKVEPAGLPSALFRQVEALKFVNVSAAARIDVALQYSHGVAAADYDADGFPDFLVTGYGGLVLWHNQGDGTFLEVHLDARLTDTQLSSSAAWGDFNGDGHLDVFILTYVDWSPKNHPRCASSETKKCDFCPPRKFNAIPSVMYFSQGDGTFEDVTQAAGVANLGKGLGVVAGDVDLDGDLDLYVGNDTVNNFLFVNDGRGHFEEIGLVSGVATNESGMPDGSMGVDIHDFNNDGRPDLWAANYQREAFAVYRNVGDQQFLHVSQSTGVAALGGLFVGWGTAFCDFDRDGDEDVCIACGHVLKHPLEVSLRQTPLLLENIGGKFRRSRFPENDYFSRAWEARGLAVGDIDNDGDLDLAVSHLNEPSALLVNESKPAGDWLGVRLIGRRSNRDAIGARLVLHTSAGSQIRFVKGGGSYLSQSDYRVFWGIPAEAHLERLEIYWPQGTRQTLVPTPGTWQTVLEPDDHAQL